MNGFASNPRCCREDTSLTGYQYITMRYYGTGTQGIYRTDCVTMMSRCWNCPKNSTYEIEMKAYDEESELSAKQKAAKNRREALSKLPHNRKSMRY